MTSFHVGDNAGPYTAAPDRSDARPNDHPDRPDRPRAVVVQNLAGHRIDDHVCGGERLHTVAADAAHRFVLRGELTPGRYLITLPRLGAAADLDPTSTVAEVGIVDGDLLLLISATPQVDGGIQGGHGRVAR